MARTAPAYRERRRGSIGFVQAAEAAARGASLPVIPEDGVFDSGGRSVVQVSIDEMKPPQWCGAHLLTGRQPLSDAVAQLSHVVQQKVGPGLEHRAVECANRARAGLHGLPMT